MRKAPRLSLCGAALKFCTHYNTRKREGQEGKEATLKKRKQRQCAAVFCATGYGKKKKGWRTRAAPSGALVADVVKDLFTGGDHVELLAGKLLQVLGIVGLFERGGEGIVLALLLLELRGKGLLFGLSAADLLPEVQKVRADEKQQSEKQ